MTKRIINRLLASLGCVLMITCNPIFVFGEDITHPPSCEHEYIISSVTESTCSTAGTTTYMCAQCGDTYSEDLPLVSHDEQYVSNEDGTHTVSCKACDYFETVNCEYDDNGICIRCGESTKQQITIRFVTLSGDEICSQLVDIGSPISLPDVSAYLPTPNTDYAWINEDTEDIVTGSEVYETDTTLILWYNSEVQLYADPIPDGDTTWQDDYVYILYTHTGANTWTGQLMVGHQAMELQQHRFDGLYYAVSDPSNAYSFVSEDFLSDIGYDRDYIVPMYYVGPQEQDAITLGKTAIVNGHEYETIYGMVEYDNPYAYVNHVWVSFNSVSNWSENVLFVRNANSAALCFDLDRNHYTGYVTSFDSLGYNVTKAHINSVSVAPGTICGTHSPDFYAYNHIIENLDLTGSDFGNTKKMKLSFCKFENFTISNATFPVCTNAKFYYNEGNITLTNCTFPVLTDASGMFTGGTGQAHDLVVTNCSFPEVIDASSLCASTQYRTIDMTGTTFPKVTDISSILSSSSTDTFKAFIANTGSIENAANILDYVYCIREIDLSTWDFRNVNVYSSSNSYSTGSVSSQTNWNLLVTPVNMPSGVFGIKNGSDGLSPVLDITDRDNPKQIAVGDQVVFEYEATSEPHVFLRGVCFQAESPMLQTSKDNYLRMVYEEYDYASPAPASETSWMESNDYVFPESALEYTSPIGAVTDHTYILFNLSDYTDKTFVGNLGLAPWYMSLYWVPSTVPIHVYVDTYVANVSYDDLVSDTPYYLFNYPCYDDNYYLIEKDTSTSKVILYQQEPGRSEMTPVAEYTESDWDAMEYVPYIISNQTQQSEDTRYHVNIHEHLDDILYPQQKVPYVWYDGTYVLDNEVPALDQYQYQAPIKRCELTDDGDVIVEYDNMYSHYGNKAYKWLFMDSTIVSGDSVITRETYITPYLIKDTIPATCLDPGTVTYYVSLPIADEIVPLAPLGHDWDTGVIVKEPTCTSFGERIVTCRRDSSHTHVVTIPMAEHDPGEPIIENLVKPTTNEEGSYDRVTYCSWCHAELSREHCVIPKLEEIIHEITRIIDPEPESEPEVYFIEPVPGIPDESQDDTEETTEPLVAQRTNNMRPIIVVAVTITLVAGAPCLFLVVWWRRRKMIGWVLLPDNEGLRVELNGKDKLYTVTDDEGYFCFKNVKEDTLLLNIYQDNIILVSIEIDTAEKEPFQIIMSNGYQIDTEIKGKRYIVTIRGE